MADNEQMKRIFEQLSEKLGTSQDKIESAVQNGNYKELFSNLDDEKRMKIEQILSDKEQTQKLLSSKQAQALMRKLMG
ncbi:MAG: hypothetical protein KBS62_04870 [Oscillospiraceae bacterium]|nr:hypothetical protein [Candidatus Ruminococcus equi]